MDNKELLLLSNEGNEYGVTTGRKRKSNWLNIDKLIKAINISGTTHLIISKVDIICKINIFKIISNNYIIEFNSINEMKNNIESLIKLKCHFIEQIYYSNSPEYILELL